MKYVYSFAMCLLFTLSAFAQDSKPAFDYMDVFELEYASDPQFSPDGKLILFSRNSFDIMEDKKRTSLWLIHKDGSNLRKLTSLNESESQGRWSPDGKKITFSSKGEHGSEIYMYWLQSNTLTSISQLENSPSSLSWSPDGQQIAFSMFVASDPPFITGGFSKPKGANWAGTPRVTTRLKHERDGSGYMADGSNQLFVISADGGTARQITEGPYNHSGKLSWAHDSQKIYFSANRSPNWEYEFGDSNIFEVDVKSKAIKQLSANNGPEYNPVVSPNGKYIAYLAYDDKVRTYQLTELRVMGIDGANKEKWISDLDRSINEIHWRKDSKAIYYSYDTRGNTKIGVVSNAGRNEMIASNVGGTTLGRPYPSGSFSLSAKNNDIVYTYSTPKHPAELATINKKGKKFKQITSLNADILDERTLGKVEELNYKSTVDSRSIQGWLIYPPNYDPAKKYPLLVENHGGPILNYGDRFTAELQLYAANGYLVFYPNPRGSTGYGEEFGDLLYNNYPGDDYQDVMDGVDYLIQKKLAYEDQLFVTGGTAGGIMTAWMIGKNNRFEAAVVHKPVINWISKTLVADNYFQYANYRYPGQPWENFETYWKFSPISLVGNIETPTMVMVGMNDLRTPPSEAKQLYHALKLRKIESALVEIPGASHGIARRPSHLITKVKYTVAWLDKYKQ